MLRLVSLFQLRQPVKMNLGLQIGGTPVGSFDYMVESVNKTVDAIVASLLQCAPVFLNLILQLHPCV